MKLADWQQWFTNAPANANQGAFLRQMTQAVDREEKGAKTQIAKNLLLLNSTYPDVVRKHPEHVKDIAKTLGVAHYFDESMTPKPGVREALDIGLLPEEAPGWEGGGAPGTAPKILKWNPAKGVAE
jgi:hypothetical protein